MYTQDGTKPLHKAAEGGHTDLVKLLLEEGINTHATNDVSHSIYMCAYWWLWHEECGLFYPLSIILSSHSL